MALNEIAALCWVGSIWQQRLRALAALQRIGRQWTVREHAVAVRDRTVGFVLGYVASAVEYGRRIPIPWDRWDVWNLVKQWTVREHAVAVRDRTVGFVLGYVASAAQRRRRIPIRWDRWDIWNLFLQFGLIWVFVLLLLGAAIAYPGLFQFANMRNIISQNAPVGIVAVGMTFVIISGGFDFSVGPVVALSAVVFANRADVTGLWGAATIVLMSTAACGMINGVLVTRLKVNPFVATLGSGSMFGGAAYIFSNNAPQTPSNPGFQYLGTQAWLGWPIASWILIAAFLAGGFVLARTVYGRSIYAIGGNSEAARLSGLRVDLLRGSTYVISALSAGLAGLILTSRLGLGQADMGGTMSLDAIAIVVVGGTSLLGGEGKMWRTAIGLLILSTLTYLFDSLAVSTSYQLVVKGAIVVGAVALDVFARSRRA